MRVRVDVETGARSLRWEDVHGPARGVAYEVIGRHDAELARVLHDEGWQGHPIKPFGMTCPQFRGAPRRRGVYTTSPWGSVWFGSPVPVVASALVTGLALCEELRWGGARLRIRGIVPDRGGAAAGGVTELSTATPLLIKKDSRYLLPGEAGFVEGLEHNLRHKADMLELPAPEGLEVLEGGPMRRFAVRGRPRVGAWARVRMEADRRFVEAIRSWGLGLETAQGFGWVR